MKANVQTTQAIVSHAPEGGKRRWILEDVQVREPGGYEAIVEMVASGVCHTDLGCGTAPDGTPGFPVPPYPRVLGHEGAGFVRAVGSKITKVKPGDAVLLSFAFCTQCHNCKFGAPGYCHEFSALNFAGTKKAFQFPTGTGPDVGGSFFGQSSFSKLSRVQETSLVNVSQLVRNKNDLKLLAPLGCGIQTGAGTVTELAAAKPSDKVAIIGLGGVGLAAIMAAKLKGCRTIIGIDRVPARIEMAKKLGATHGIDTSTISNLVNEVRKVTEGSGSTITVDATGVLPLIQQGLEFTANQGKMILLGVAPMDAGLEIAVVPYMVTGKQIMGSMEGGVYPEDYIPKMIRWYQNGEFPVDELIKFYPVQDYQKAIRDMEDGSTIKPVLIW
ncbi:PKS-ER domain-containing protein [Fusarium falciforme]|uniref:PKS-ER domain-containing protein n=1 Tax=Fusarium falciforme TaxID=195108 RepID=UPI0023003547|nr:PKS-ER domain-containing protein [Fusarium falciforme]WAO91621.1 PKS-ER domain-containing protein [Fusarium falciforme]